MHIFKFELKYAHKVHVNNSYLTPIHGPKYCLLIL